MPNQGSKEFEAIKFKLGDFQVAAAIDAHAVCRIFSHAGNTVTVYWQDVPGWALQQNGNLASSAGWSASSGATLLNGTNYLNITSPPGNLFFRLKQ